MNNKNPKFTPLDRKLSNGVKINRRQFLHSSAVLGTGLMLGSQSFGAEKSSKLDQINVAFIGVGKQGKELMTDCLKLGKDYGVRIKAICDIWQAVSLKAAAKTLDAYGQQYNTYIDYKEMLDKEKDLDAAIIATPLFCHSQQTIDCLKAGLHVYCEKEMSNTVEGARKMVEAAEQTGKLLQIGRQRRSDVEYIHCCEKLLKEANILGRITTANAQWNRSVRPDLGAPPQHTIDQAVLEKYGYKSMEQFRNWKWYKGLGAGYLIELGSHQIDVFNWFLDAVPKSVIASGGIQYYDKKNHQWPDHVMAVFEYETSQGTVRASYQLTTTNSSQGYFEKFMGDQGTLVISLESGKTAIYREDWVAAEKWDEWVKKDYIRQLGRVSQTESEDTALDVHSSVPPTSYCLTVKRDLPSLQLHLKNFFDSIRGKATLTCPAQTAYKAAVVILKTNEAAEADTKLYFKPEDFKV